MLFGRKKKEDNLDEAEDIATEESASAELSGDVSVGRVAAELEKLKAKFSTFYELQKASNERFTRLNEQAGELRAMILDRDKESKLVEAKATQAIDLVSSVQPDKLMIELKKADNRIEIFKSSIESNEVILSNAISELKELRTKVNSFKGIEESVKLAEEVKNEWLENKKLDANITKHSSKVETIYSEMWKKFSGFEKFASIVSDLDKAVKQMASEVDSIKVKITGFSNKKEIENLIIKFESFEKYMNNVVSALDKKISNFENDFSLKFKTDMQKAATLLKGFETLAAKTPDLDKYFNLLSEEAKKAPKEEVKVEKIKTPGQEEPIKGEEKEGLFGKLKGKLKK
ncbi:MAG: hypothetical protein ABIC04_04135 [Nanoarchaeota archaeon]